MSRISRRDLVLQGWPSHIIDSLLNDECNVPVEKGETPVRMYSLSKVVGTVDSYSAEYEPTNMKIPERKVNLQIENNLFEIKNKVRKLGFLNTQKIEKLIYKAIEKNDITKKIQYSFVITYPRENNLYSSLSFFKSKTNYMLLDVIHSNEPNEKLSFFPKERNRINLTFEEAEKAIS